MKTIRAVRIREPGDVDVLELGEVTLRDTGPGEVRVKVAAAGLNRADLMQRAGYYPAPPGVIPDVPGLEYAGVVEAAGGEVRGVAVGDRVMGLVGGGAMAEALVVHHRELVAVPEGMPLTDAAAIPEAFATAWDALVQAGARLGDVVLVHAAASGVGTAATQLARLMGARVIGTGRNAAKLARCAAWGLDETVVAKDGAFADEVLALTGGAGVDVVIDLVGGTYLAESVRCAAPRARVVMLATTGGLTATLPLGLALSRRVTVTTTVLRSRPVEEKIALARGFARAVLPAFAKGTLRPVVDAVLPMGAVREAHERMARDETVGKIVLAW
jgi:putative PIG3 family NAD(P)H quinone oxidoreductase